MTQMNYVPAATPVDEEQDEQSKNKAELANRVKNSAKVLKGGFGDKKNYKNELFIRNIAVQLFKDRLSNLDLSDVDYTIDAHFRAIMEDMGENAEEIVDELRNNLLRVLQAGRSCATKEVTLKGGIQAMDMTKAYFGFKPASQLINATYFSAVD